MNKLMNKAARREATVNDRLLKAKMVERDKSAKQMAQACDMSLSSWYHKLSGISVFTLNEAKTVALNLNLTPREFLLIFFPEVAKEGKR